MNTYEVAIRSKPGFYEQYAGTVTVTAENDDAALEAAFRKLRRTAFPDRTRSMWRVESVSRIY